MFIDQIFKCPKMLLGKRKNRFQETKKHSLFYILVLKRRTPYWQGTGRRQSNIYYHINHFSLLIHQLHIRLNISFTIVYIVCHIYGYIKIINLSELVRCNLKFLQHFQKFNRINIHMRSGVINVFNFRFHLSKIVMYINWTFQCN